MAGVRLRFPRTGVGLRLPPDDGRVAMAGGGALAGTGASISSARGHGAGSGEVKAGAVEVRMVWLGAICFCGEMRTNLAGATAQLGSVRVCLE